MENIVAAPPAVIVHAEPYPLLAGADAPLERPSLVATVEALLRRPANVMNEVRSGRAMPWKLSLIVVATMAITGFFVAAGAGGLQLLVVPLKTSLGMVACALICLPSLYIFAALSGGEQSLRETFGALMLGIGLMGVLLVGFAPVSWVFAQATASPVFLGALHLFFLLVSAAFGLRLTRRALVARSGRPIAAIGLWSAVFLLVVLQMSTTLRPLVGPYQGLALAPRQFFVLHWLS